MGDNRISMDSAMTRYANLTEAERAWGAMLAARPDSGTVPVPRELLERAAKFSEAWPSYGGAELARELRALLSRSGNKGDGR